MDVNHSKQGAYEVATEMIANGTVCKELYSYTAHWIVADCRSDFLLGMPTFADDESRTSK